MNCVTLLQSPQKYKNKFKCSFVHIIMILTLYCLARDICDAVTKFYFNLGRDHQKIPMSVATMSR